MDRDEVSEADVGSIVAERELNAVSGLNVQTHNRAMEAEVIAARICGSWTKSGWGWPGDRIAHRLQIHTPDPLAALARREKPLCFARTQDTENSAMWADTYKEIKGLVEKMVGFSSSLR